MRVARVLLVDDEETLRVSLSFTLAREGYEVSSAGEGTTALRLLREEDPDIVILDVMLPGIDGMQVCRWIRSMSNVPIVMLSARDEVDDKVLALSTGADDYVTKPFSTRELVARLQAVLRRRAATPTIGAPVPPAAAGLPVNRGLPAGRGLAPLLLVQSGVIEAGTIRLDLDRHEVRVRNRRVDLSPKEFQLLHVLLSHRGRVLTREALLASVWGEDFCGDPKTLDVHVRWLRAKIERSPAQPHHIITVRGVGFRFD